MLLFLLKALGAISLATLINASYVLNPEDVYQGNTFFEKFNFFTARDPNWGYVKYLDQSAASNTKLISINDQQQAYIGVDYENTYDVNDAFGRPSIRLETKKAYQYGLFVFDMAHMPDNTCGKWSAFWTTNHQDWPRWGEIDIIENINENNNTLEALHTGPGCSVAGNQISSQMTGKQTTFNCDGKATSSKYGTQGSGQGCVAENTNPNNYGKAFNDVGGGVYAMEWTNQAINIWHFTHENIPKDLNAGNPNPDGWTPPVFTTKQGSCDIDGNFKDQTVIIDSAFCGNWAGQDGIWKETSCYKSDPVKYPTCNSFVANNPAVYKDSYWLINSLKVYQNLAGSPANNSVPAPSVPNTPTSSSDVPSPPALNPPAPNPPAPNLPAPNSPAPNSPAPNSPAPNSSGSSLTVISSPSVSDSNPVASGIASRSLDSPSDTQTTALTPGKSVSSTAIPYNSANSSAPIYHPTSSASGTAYSPITSALATQTLPPDFGEASKVPAQPTSRQETAGGSKAFRVGESSFIALIVALALGMAF